MIPVYAFLEGDSLGLLIFTYEEETVVALAEKVRTSARCRVNPGTARQLSVFLEGKELDRFAKVHECGITPLSIIEVRRSAARWSDAS
jgi:hypothetical protein